MKKVPVPLLIALVSLIALILVSYISLDLEKKTKTSTTTAVVSNTPTSSPTPKAYVDDTLEVESRINPLTGWKVYENAEYGFSFEYPPEWKLKQDRTSGVELYLNSRTHSQEQMAWETFRVSVQENYTLKQILIYNNEGEQSQYYGQHLVQSSFLGYPALKSNGYSSLNDSTSDGRSYIRSMGLTFEIPKNVTISTLMILDYVKEDEAKKANLMQLSPLAKENKATYEKIMKSFKTTQKLTQNK